MTVTVLCQVNAWCDQCGRRVLAGLDVLVQNEDGDLVCDECAEPEAGEA